MAMPISAMQRWDWLSPHVGGRRTMPIMIAHVMRDLAKFLRECANEDSDVGNEEAPARGR